MRSIPFIVLLPLFVHAVTAVASPVVIQWKQVTNDTTTEYDSRKPEDAAVIRTFLEQDPCSQKIQAELQAAPLIAFDSDRIHAHRTRTYVLTAARIDRYYVGLELAVRYGSGLTQRLGAPSRIFTAGASETQGQVCSAAPLISDMRKNFENQLGGASFASQPKARPGVVTSAQ